MTIFDFIVIALVSASVVAGALRGLVRGLVTGAALLIGLFVAAQGYQRAGLLLRGLSIVESNAAADAGGFLLILLLALIAGFVLGHVVMKSLQRARLKNYDRALGAAFGLIRGLTLCSIIYLALTAFPLRLSSVTQARTAPVLAEGARLLTTFTSRDVRTRFFDEHEVN